MKEPQIARVYRTQSITYFLISHSSLIFIFNWIFEGFARHCFLKRKASVIPKNEFRDSCNAAKVEKTMCVLSGFRNIFGGNGALSKWRVTRFLRDLEMSAAAVAIFSISFCSYPHTFDISTFC